MFDHKLENVVGSVPGGQAAIVMGFDGIPVDSFQVDKDLDIETIGMEFSVVLKEVRKAADLLASGPAEEFVVRTARVSTILRVISDEYFIAMTLAPDGNLGKARYVLRMVAPKLKQDLI